MVAVADIALDGLLSDLGLHREDLGGRIRFVDDDPIVPSRHRVGAASAAAIAGEAVGIGIIWRMRTGRGQDLTVDLRRAAIPGLRTLSMITQNGYDLHFEKWRTKIRSFFKTKDGFWFYLLRAPAFPLNVVGLMDLLDCSSSTESVEAAVKRWNAADLEEALSKARLIGVQVRTRDEWLSHPQGKLLASQPLINIRKVGDGPPEPIPEGERPLSGTRVLDLGNVIAGPVGARVLAEQGADVLHLSAPMTLDDLRVVIDTSVGKRSAYIDLNAPSDIDRLVDLVREGDVFIQSYRPGSLAGRGLAVEDLASLRPGIIYGSISAFGFEGPWASRGGFDPVGQSVSGLSYAEGAPGMPVSAPTYTLNDYLAAYLLSAGIVAALIRRSREGGSFEVKVSLARCSMWLQELGQLPDSVVFGDDPSDRTLPEARREDFIEMDGPFGRIRHAKPIVDFSETVARWDLPASPLGSSAAEWLPKQCARADQLAPNSEKIS